MDHLQLIMTKDARFVFKKDELGVEIFRIALPTALSLLADPVASLIDTAFIGRIGPVELAAVGVSIAVFNQVSKLTIFPLVSVTTSFVAEEESLSRLNEAQEIDNLEKGLQIEELETKAHSPVLDQQLPIEKDVITKHDLAGPDQQLSSEKQVITKADNSHGLDQQLPSENEVTTKAGSKSDSQQLSSKQKGKPQTIKLKKINRRLSSASSALVFSSILGILQAIFLISLAKPILNIMGVKFDSPMLTPAREYLILRSLGSPAILLSLAMQGIFRGLKDTKTPLYAIVLGDITNIILDPILMFIFHFGVRGAALAHIISQYLISIILLLSLMRRINILPHNIKDLQFSRFLKSGSLLLARVVAVTVCVTLAASMAARHGAITMAAFQICLQIWMTTSLINDGLAVAGQAILATAFAERDNQKAIATARRVLQLAVIMGLVLACLVGVGLQFGSRLFTKDIHVLHLISIGIPFVAAMQPINALSFVLDGVNFGASDFTFAACSTVLVAIVSIPCLFILSATHGFVGIWIALTVYMTMRTFVGFGRIGTGSGPWCILRN